MESHDESSGESAPGSGPTGQVPGGDEPPAHAVPDPRDRRKGERRGGRDRRAGTEPPAGVERRAGDRRGPDRRAEPPVPDLYRAGARHINEYPLAADEMEFINAINAYRNRHQRPFPTWSEVLHIMKALGYTKPGTAEPPSAP